MYLVTVIPIARGIGREELSYVSPHDAVPGSVLSVPLRKRQVPAIVTESIPAKDAKTRIRQAAFTLKKADAQIAPRQFLAAPMLQAVRAIAREHAGTTGAALHTLTPKAILDDPDAHTHEMTTTYTEAETAVEKLILQAPRSERLETYRNLIRESFARNESVFILAPTTKDVAALHEYLEKGIATYTFALHGSLTKKEQRRRWDAARSTKHPVLIVATASFLTLPRTDIAAYIIEREQSRFYKTATRPYIDIRVAAEHIARAARARCIFADMPVRVETYYRFESGDMDEFTPPQQVLRKHPPITIADTRTPAEAERKIFQVIGEELHVAIQNALKTGGHVFIHAPRRGIAATTVCQDCGQTVQCSVCGATMVLHRGRPRNVFRCHVCGESRSAHERCAACESWRLKELGVGIQRVTDAVHACVPKHTPVHMLDADTARTHSQAAKIAARFYSAPGSILIGTDMAIPYIQEPVAVTATASIDAVLAIPDFRVSERTLATIVGLQEQATEACIIQTRNPDSPLLTALSGGRLFDIYRAERDIRKQCAYPPFTTLILIRYGGSTTPPSISKLTESYAQYVAGTLTITDGRQTDTGILLKIPRDIWPDTELLSLLTSLPQRIRVDVHPERLF